MLGDILKINDRTHTEMMRNVNMEARWSKQKQKTNTFKGRLRFEELSFCFFSVAYISSDKVFLLAFDIDARVKSKISPTNRILARFPQIRELLRDDVSTSIYSINVAVCLGCRKLIVRGNAWKWNQLHQSERNFSISQKKLQQDSGRDNSESICINIWEFIDID